VYLDVEPAIVNPDHWKYYKNVEPEYYVTTDPDDPESPELRYSGEVQKFVYYSNYYCYKWFTANLKSDVIEWIDDTFPWIDGYKPKGSQVKAKNEIELSWLEATEEVFLDILPREPPYFGWVGLC